MSLDNQDSGSDSDGDPYAVTRRRRDSFKLSYQGVETPDAQQTREIAESIFSGKKRRRPSSEMKKFVGDHVGIGDNTLIPLLLHAHDDQLLLFMDRTSRLALHSHMTECICLVSENHVYILNNRLGLQDDMEPFPITTIEKISTSTERDNAIVIHLPDYKTELLMTPYKTELVSILVSRFRALAERDLEVNFSNVIDFPVNENTLFEVDFLRAAEGVKMTVFCKAAEGNNGG
jgi:hypothetical protein